MCTHWYGGMGRTGGIAVWIVGQWVSLWESHVYPLVQWDGTDRWDSSMDYGTVNGNPIHAFCQASCGTCESANAPVDISWQDWTLLDNEAPCHVILDCVCSNATCL